MTRLYLRSVLAPVVVTMVVLSLLVAPGQGQTRPSRLTRGGRSTQPTSAPAPNYPFPYRTPRIDAITRLLHLVKSQVEARAMTTVTTQSSEDPMQRAEGRTFALVSYPMGVVYSGMLSASEATGDKSFAQFDADRFQLFANEIAKIDPSQPPSRRARGIVFLLNPRSLDDCGAVGTALVKARRQNVGPDLHMAIDRIANYISHKQLRLEDGTLARSRPFRNSLWADDEYMGIPFLAEMGALTGDQSYFDDAAQQILHFAHYLYQPETGLFTHHWNTSNADDEPTYYWGRANGWCTMAMAEVLDVLPENHPLRGQILRLFRQHCRALASLQAGDGLWHQMLDRSDTGTETSCSAMFVYCLAHGVNKGWLDSAAYGPVAQAGWLGLAARIDEQGHITGTCVGTGYADDYIYYYHRPLVDDIHGYGPTLLAGAEIIKMLKNQHLMIYRGPAGGNPIMYYDRSTTFPSYDPSMYMP
jgi:unsaturated rhamnogalacturonyl hydrolase